MAEFFCSFSDFRSLTTSYNLRLLLPSKHVFSFSLHSHNSRISIIKRRPLHPTLLSRPSSSDFDVISTHEHSDGSVLFRFGDPSEAAKNVKMEEYKTVEEKIEGEGENGSTVVRVVEDDNESELMAIKADREVTRSSLTEVADHSNSIVSSRKTVTVVEGENASCEKLLEDSNDTELPVLTSTEEMEDISTKDVDIEHIGNVEGSPDKEFEDLSPEESSTLDESSKTEKNIARVELSEKETACIINTPDIDIQLTGNVEEDLNEEYEDSPCDASTLDKGSEVARNITNVEVSEDETADTTRTPDIDLEHAVNVVEGLDAEHKESSMVNASIPDMSTEAGLETAVPTGVSPISEQNLETEMQNETTKDGTDSSDSNLVSPSPKPEPALTLLKKIEEQNLEDEMQEVATEKSREGNSNDLIQLMTESPQLEADPVLEEEIRIGIVEESREKDDEFENLTVDGHLVESSVHGVTVTESNPISQEMLTTNFVLSSGAALLPHPSKVLTGGEDAYFIAGETWLGVADGVGQWSLEGTSPGVYAQELIKICEKLITDCNGDSINNPVELLDLIVARTDFPGSSTVVIAQFDGQALHVANVGDSGFIVLRHGAVYKRSSPMQHVFHFPLQIERGEDPSSLAESYRVDLEEDDIIITATDGLLDNLYDQEISFIVMKFLAAGKSLEEVAELLARKAQDIGSSASARSPFADDAQAAGFAGYTGGKLDDVAVIVSVVKRCINSHTL